MSFEEGDYISYFNKMFRAFKLKGLNGLKKKVYSLREYSKRFEIPYPSFRLKTINYLNNKFGVETALEIQSQLWPSTHHNVQLKKSGLKDDIMFQLKKYYPKNISSIKTLSELAYKWHLNRITVTKWIKEWLYQEYGRVEANQLFNEIWTSKKNRNNPIAYNDIIKFVRNKAGHLITKENLYNSMKERPSKRYIEIKCENKHKSWTTRVGHLFYDDTWCPICLERKCQEIMRFYMNNLFNSYFKPEVSLRQTCGHLGRISRKIELYGEDYEFVISTGKLRFDGYKEKIMIKGRDGNLYVFKIAFEYDGIQHDTFSPIFHKTISEFANQLIRDEVKLEIAEKFRIILIRIKECDGFNCRFLVNNPIKVQKEILDKFYEKVEKIYQIKKEILKISPIMDLCYKSSNNLQTSIDTFI